MTDTSISAVTAGDGTRIAVHDLGGSGPPLLLAHATGFHARAYQPLAEALGTRHRIVGYDARAHGASDPPPLDDSGTWRLSPDHFAADVLAVVDALGLEQPAGFGHSAGASALVLAEQARPGTFSALYCFEPIIAPLDDPVAPDPDNALSRGARQRRRTFPSRQAAYENYAAKAPLSQLDPRALRAYVEFGLAPDPAGGVRLCCDPDHEALMYARGLTHHAFRHLGELSCPVTLACGQHTDAIGPDVLALLAARLAHPRVEVLAAVGHFGPPQHPTAVAASVLGALGRPAQR